VERANFNLKIKSVDDTGSFVGMGAVFNNIDLGNDLIEPGAFARTLSAGKKFPLLWQHDPSNPIGSVEASETPQGLMVKGQLLLDDPTAMKAYQLLKAGIIKGLSIGYDTIKDAMDGTVRRLKELRLWEVSVVTFPMNEAAMVTSVKGVSDADRAKHLKAISDHRKAIDRHQQGIQMHLKSLLDGVDDEEDPVLEDDEDDGTKAFLVELQKLAKQASEFAAL